MTTTGRRPTPADPTPEPAAGIPSGTVRNLPPELGPDAIGVLDGLSFMFSDSAGDVPPGSIGGLVHEDTRFLSRWQLTLNGSRPLLLGSSPVDAFSAAFFLANPDLPDLPANRVGIRRQRLVGEGMYERIGLQCFTDDPVPIQLRLAVGVDFADLFEIKEQVRDRSAQIVRDHAADCSQLSFSYRNGEFTAGTEVRAIPAASRIEDDDLVWDLVLTPGEVWQVELHVPLRYVDRRIVPTRREFGEVFEVGDETDSATRWQAGCPDVRADSDSICDVFHKSVADLVSMRVEKEVRGERVVMIAAGLPWFLTLFGRDSLITSYQVMLGGPELARGALIVVAAHQATELDDFTDREPGKMLHEHRSGELTRLGLKPHNPYYGAADTTQLWLIVLSEYWRWTGDEALLQDVRDNAYAALRWIDEYGDRDGDGYVEYATRSSEGLGNQCWRDSWNGVQFADGTIPVLPIAICEIQGYTYDAKLRMAELADGPYRDPGLARRLRDEAAALADRFNRDFWIEDRGGYYALGLDGDKRRIDSMTSNMGHLLWSGIVPPERAAMVARQLMSDELFSGWGVRTLSTEDRGYNPIGYHLGTVWPHDNSLIAYGLARYGFRAEANRIIEAMLEAARYSDDRLPEAFSGYDRAFGRIPVPYPTACNPQAWASAAPLLFLRTMLGLEARDGQLLLDPAIPERFGRIQMTGVHGFGQRWDLEANGTQGHLRLSDR
ncbi:amylo-alpha-1,6-glucosidase [Plantactinospora alkalitolerans]|uniref:amylo-alpha-1,6-glucosidase n=1 Tax=Plantactinospora alkalitolerans TaxID=2789879 RepID=UPI002B20F76A|nr:glycogen debranching N-terminal domain-containing protein [Plantactinospora alkalitolerans]